MVFIERSNLETQYRELPGTVMLCPETELLTELTALIEQHYRDQHNQTFYCQKLNTTYYYLNSRTQYYLNKTVNEIVLDRLYQESCLLLSNTLMSVKIIAYELGFSDPSNFIRFFRRFSGTSPARFRKFGVDVLMYKCFP